MQSNHSARNLYTFSSVLSKFYACICATQNECFDCKNRTHCLNSCFELYKAPIEIPKASIDIARATGTDNENEGGWEESHGIHWNLWAHHLECVKFMCSMCCYLTALNMMAFNSIWDWNNLIYAIEMKRLSSLCVVRSHTTANRRRRRCCSNYSWMRKLCTTDIIIHNKTIVCARYCESHANACLCIGVRVPTIINW